MLSGTRTGQGWSIANVTKMASELHQDPTTDRLKVRRNLFITAAQTQGYIFYALYLLINQKSESGDEERYGLQRTGIIYFLVRDEQENLNAN